MTSKEWARRLHAHVVGCASLAPAHLCDRLADRSATRRAATLPLRCDPSSSPRPTTVASAIASSQLHHHRRTSTVHHRYPFIPTQSSLSLLLSRGHRRRCRGRHRLCRPFHHLTVCRSRRHRHRLLPAVATAVVLLSPPPSPVPSAARIPSGPSPRSLATWAELSLLHPPTTGAAARCPRA